MIFEGDILTPAGWLRGALSCDGAISSVQGAAVQTPRAPYILPGFVDLHCHGGAGADVMRGAAAVRQTARAHARCGTTAFLPTTATAPGADIAAALSGVAEAMAAPDPQGARILGVHLEGPFINPAKLGAQPPFAQPGDAALFRSWAALAPIRVATLAPECDADGSLAAAMLAAGVRVQIGHSTCGYAQAAACIDAGWGVTHLFNAMSGLTHRDNGAVGAAFAHARYAEVIPDLRHVEAGALLAARRAIPRLYGVTDATAAAGAPDGFYDLGAHRVEKRGDIVLLADGAFAGSCLTMDQALRNLVAIGLPLAEASQRLSTFPADWIGAPDIGRIEPGARADLAIMDADLRITQVVIGGEIIGG